MSWESQFPPMVRSCPDSLVLFLALTEDQFAATQRGTEAIPDLFSKRFGMRTTPQAAVHRAEEFMNWKQTEEDKRTLKSFIVVQVEITPLGYMKKCESDILHKYKVGEYRWQGPIKSEEYDTSGQLLYRFGSHAAMYE